MENNDLTFPLSAAALQLRMILENLYLAAARLLPFSDRESDPELDRQAAVLDRSFFRLLRLADNLALAARLSAPLPLTDADIVDLVGEVCDRAGGLAHLLDLRLRFLCAPESRFCALAPEATVQLLYHLLSNALRSSVPGGTVTVALRFTAGRVLLSVADTGCGFPENQLPALFDRGSHASPLPPSQGTGLGLALCQRIAGCQGGVLIAESHRGRGSRVTLSLPDRRCGKTAAPRPFDPAGGFNPTLIALADALPPEAFLLRSQG